MNLGQAVVAIWILAMCASLSAAHKPTKESEAECSALRTTSKSSYSYSNDASNGPRAWGSLDESYSACSKGKKQSPINLVTNYNRSGFEPRFMQKRSVMKFEAVKNNFEFQCDHDFGKCASMQVRNTSFDLVQLHMHSPSEHHIGGVSYPLEMHFVHKAASGKLGVLGVLFKIGDFNIELDHLLQAAATRHYAVVDIEELAGTGDADTCSFSGSLTTPPCSEGVQWVLSLRIMEASLRQIGQYREMVGEKATNRPLQPVNARAVYCFSKTKQHTRELGL